MNIYRSMAVVGILGCMGSPVQAMRIAMSLPAMVGGSDLVVTARVADEGAAGQMKIVLPGIPQGMDRWYSVPQLEVRKVHFAQGEAARAVRTGQTIPVVTWARKPEKQEPGKLRVIMADGPDFPALRQGTTYVLVLRALDDGKRFYLQPDARLFVAVTRATADRARALVAAADVAQWPWGKPVNGLRLALAPERREFALTMGQRRQGGPRVRSARVGFVAALQNVTDQPIVVCHFQPDKFLGMTLTSPPAAAEPVDLYGAMPAGAPTFGAEHVSVIPPGRMLLLAHYGKGPYGDYVELHTAAGKKQLQLTYSSQREGTPPRDTPLWQGRLSSGTAAITILPQAAR